MDQSSEENYEDGDGPRPNHVGENGNKKPFFASGRDPLHDAAEQGDWKKIKELILSGPLNVVNIRVGSECSKPGEPNYEGWTALHFAARQRHIEAVRELLIPRSCDPNLQGDVCGDTPLHVAASCGWADIVEKLLLPRDHDKNDDDTAIRVDVNIVDKEGQTALHKAALESPDAYKYLDESPDVSRREKVHQKLLRAANPIPMFKAIGDLHATSRSCYPKEGVNKEAGRDYGKVADWLLNRSDTRLTIEDNEGRTAFDLASKNKDGKVFEHLRLKVTPEVSDYNEPYYKERQANVDAANAILVGAALIASVTFAAFLNPPLGYTIDYQEQYANAFPAPPTSNPVYASLEHHPLLEWFWAFNSLAFFCAIGTVISGAHSVLPFRKSTIKREVTKLRVNLLLTSTLMAFAMGFVLLAFATAGIVVLPPVPRFKDNIFSTVGVGGGLCTFLLLRLGWNIYSAAHS